MPSLKSPLVLGLVALKHRLATISQKIEGEHASHLVSELPNYQALVSMHTRNRMSIVFVPLLDWFTPIASAATVYAIENPTCSMYTHKYR